MAWAPKCGADAHVTYDFHADARLIPVEASAQENAAADAVVPLTECAGFDFETITAHARYGLDCHKAVRREREGSSKGVIGVACASDPCPKALWQ